MSIKYNIETTIGFWCANHGIPLEDAVELTTEVLLAAGHIDIDPDDELSEEVQEARVRKVLRGIYQRFKDATDGRLGG